MPCATSADPLLYSPMNQRSPFLRTAVKLLLCIGVLADTIAIGSTVVGIILQGAVTGGHGKFVSTLLISLIYALPLIMFLLMAYIFISEPQPLAAIMVIAVLMAFGWQFLYL